MKIILIFSSFIVFISVSVKAQSNFAYSFILKQAGSYFISDRVTIGGMGMGIGAQIEDGKNLAAQFDGSILWGNGNAVSTRLAAGYQLDSKWSPALFLTAGLLWGQRTEVLSVNGRRPAAPVWILGFRITPIRFKVESGFISALEIGYGIGPDGGRDLEISILSAGIKI